MIIDIHVHPFVSEKEILEEMKRARVDYAVLLAVDADPSDAEKPEIKGKLRSRHLGSFRFSASHFMPIEDQIKSFFQGLISYYPDLKSTNQEIAELVRGNPEKFIGFGSVNPNKDASYIDAKLGEIGALGFRGVKMLPTLQLFSPVENKNFRKICEYCEREKKILLFHTGCDPGPWETPELSEDANPKYLRNVLETCKPTVILAHTGSYSAYKPGIWFEEALELGKMFDNVYFDSAAVSSFIYSEEVIRKIRNKVGLDRLLYGSDYPVVFGSDMKYEVDVVSRCAFLSQEEKEGILCLNAARILGL